jgi:hypothetical protein
LGNSDDLKIYHDGTKSYIDNNTGDLEITTPARIELQGNNGSSTMSRYTSDGPVELFHANSKKFETTSLGVNITDDELRIGTNSGSGSDCLIRIGSHGTGANQQGVIKYDAANNFLSLIIAGDGHGTGGLQIRDGGETRSNHFTPHANNTYDLGTSSLRWRNIYTNDLHLSNEGSSNDMDGTWGDWTIQEGESDLFLKNNRSGKKYKFNLTEVS